MIYGRPIILCSLLTIGILLNGCNRPAGQGSRAYGDSLTIVTYHAPAAINPLTAVSGISATLSDAIFDGLVKLDEQLEPRPHLASSYKSSEDYGIWTFYIRKGIKFHDDTELTTEDVKFTIEQLLRYAHQNPYAGLFKDIQSIQIRDKYTIDIILKKPSIFFIYSMNFGILPSHILKGRKREDIDFGYNPVGTGPFKLTMWNQKEITLEANKGYFLGRPYLDRIIVKVYPDQEQAWAKMMQGEGDFLHPVNPSVYGFLNQVSSLKVYKTHGLFFSIIAFNNQNRLFNNRKVKVALNYAIDREYIIRNILNGMGLASSGTIRPGSGFFNPDIRPYPYEPRKALALLKEAGWIDSDGDTILDNNGIKFSFTLLVNEGDEMNNRAAMYIQQQLWELGISVNTKTIPVTSIDKLIQGKFDAVLIDIFSHVFPDYNYNIWHSSQINKGNICRYKSFIIDKLLEDGRASGDMNNAKQVYHRYQQEMYNDPPGIFLYWADHLLALHKRFRGVRFTSAGILTYVNEWYVPESEQKN
ncbi:MAG: hypothetical protein A2035_03805 [Nitrospirae bacterium GWA2_42_11]|nr:MAG: hypothetical protein A2035_03805 [Nitrospirae bacterium GWA2_42_11]